jgi:hypothetical protein
MPSPGHQTHPPQDRLSRISLNPFLLGSYGGFRAEGMAQVVEGLPSKLQALSSNPGTAKKKKKKNHMESL